MDFKELRGFVPFDTETTIVSSYKRNEPCVLHTGCRASNGYGQVRRGGVTRTAHREAYRVANGLSWTDMVGVVVRHTCDVRLCVQPSHLISGTQSQNLHDKKRPRRVFIKLTREDAADIKVRLANGETQTSIATLYGVTQAMISSIKVGKTWRPEDLPAI